MASEIVGFNGSVKIATQAVAGLNKFKLSLNIPGLDSSVFSDAWETVVTGVKSWTADVEGNCLINTDTNGQVALQTAALAGTDVALRLYINNTNYWAGNAKITKFDVDASSPELIKIMISFKGNGQLNYN